MRYECRYSSSEMMYLEVTATDVRCNLDHSPDRATIWTFAEAAAGAMDTEVRNLFSEDEIDEVKALTRELVV